MSRFQEYIESDQGPEDLCKEIEQLNKRLADAYSTVQKTRCRILPAEVAAFRRCKMTAEEKAEEYVKGLCKTCTFDTCRHNALQTCAIKESLKQAYLDGLEASKPKWHKIT